MPSLLFSTSLPPRELEQSRGRSSGGRGDTELTIATPTLSWIRTTLTRVSPTSFFLWTTRIRTDGRLTTFCVSFVPFFRILVLSRRMDASQASTTDRNRRRLGSLEEPHHQVAAQSSFLVLSIPPSFSRSSLTRQSPWLLRFVSASGTSTSSLPWASSSLPLLLDSDGETGPEASSLPGPPG